MAKLHDGLRAVQMGFNAPKTRYNKFGEYHYRNAEDMEAGLKPLLDEQGLTMVIDDEVVNIGERFYVKATVTVTDGTASVVSHGWAREVEAKTKSDPAQITGMASSYARKYALGGLFLVDDQPDADSQDNTERRPDPDPLQEHKARLWAAVCAYADKTGGDANALAAGCTKREDHEETAEWYAMVAEEFESQL